MKVLRNHFKGKPIIFIGDNVIYDGMIFDSTNLDKLFEMFDIPSLVEQDIINNIGFFSANKIRQFAYDDDEEVRFAIAKCGFALDILVNDKEWFIREAVANHGYGLNILINDESPYVRAAVARQGYGLGILMKDENIMVRQATVAKFIVFRCLGGY
jgi:uncharacterized protein YcgL (UPF0745 family)